MNNIDANWIPLTERRPDHGNVVWFDSNNAIWWTDYKGRGGVLPGRPHHSPKYWIQLSHE